MTGELYALSLSNVLHVVGSDLDGSEVTACGCRVYSRWRRFDDVFAALATNSRGVPRRCGRECFPLPARGRAWEPIP